MILNASAANGSSSSALRSSSCSSFTSSALDGRDVDRARQVVDDRVEQGLHALVLERGAAQHRDDVARDGGRAHGDAQVVGGDLLLADVLLEHVLVVLADRRRRAGGARSRRRRRAPQGCRRSRSSRPCRRPTRAPSSTSRSMTPWNSLSAPIGSCTTATLASRRSLIMSTAAVEVGADAVHLVDEAHPRHVVLVGLAPDRLGLGLHAGDRVEHRHRAVEHAQRALHLDREVDVAGGVDDVDPAVAPLAGGGGAT